MYGIGMVKIQAVIVAVRDFSPVLQAKFFDYYKAPVIQISNQDGGGICDKYNKGLEKLNLDDNSWIIFSHDDVDLLSPLEEVYFQLNNASGDGYKVVAVAGNTEVPPLFPGFWWHGLTTKEFRGSGAVVHKTPGTEKMRHIESYGPYPQQIAAFDGLWFAVKAEVFKSFKFDPFIDGYHYYDADFCAQARAHNVPMCSAGILVYHNQWGKGIEDSNFNRLQKKFIEKWKSKLSDYRNFQKIQTSSAFVTGTSAF